MPFPVVTDIFGRIVPAFVLEDAVALTIKTWIEVYLREVELQWGIQDQLVLPRSYNVHPDAEKWPEEQLPAVVVVSPGTSEMPEKDGEQRYCMNMTAAACIFATGTTKKITNRNVKLYAAAVRAILLHKRSLGGLCDGVIFESETYEEGPTDQGRTLGLGVVTMSFYVPDAVSGYGGPVEPPDPDTQPGEDWETVATTDLDVNQI